MKRNFLPPLSRRAYTGWGLGLMALKYNIDRLIAYLGFHMPWAPWDYLNFEKSLLNPVFKNPQFYLTLALVALPFIGLGIYFTLRRLKDIGLPLWLTVIFFLPFLNLIFFFILCLLPTKENEVAQKNHEKKSWLKQLLPHSALGSAAVSVLISAILGLGFAILSANKLEYYGWGLFCGVPFFQGFLAVTLAAQHEPMTFKKANLLASLTIGITGLIIFLLAFEGAICLIMAAPLGWVLSLLGATMAYLIQIHQPSSHLHCFSILSLPALMMIEAKTIHTPPMLHVKTEVKINAPPEKVWPQVIAFSQLPIPCEFFFKIGIAYPIRAEINGYGKGAVRKCVFSTGAFVEPITVWQEPNLLRFEVTEQPPAMTELSLYQNLNPPHLDHYLRSRQGQFLLKRQPDGSTLLEGTTWYDNHMWPQIYWRLWSQYLIHKIHQRVLNHIKAEVENKT